MRDEKRRLPVAGLFGSILALLALAAGAAGMVAAQPAGPDPTPAPTGQPQAASDLPPEARTALDDFLQDDPQTQQRIPLQFYQVALPLVAAQVELGPGPDPATPADIIVTLRPNPSIRVDRASQLAYILRVRNAGPAPAGRVDVRLPLDPAALTLDNFAGEIAGDFVSERSPGRVTVTFATLSPDEQRSATLLFNVNDALPDDTVISTRASFEWEDQRDGGSGRSNWAPVLVGSFNNSSRYLFLEVQPDRGPAGAFFNAYTDRFLPNEPVTAWFNTPDGVEPLERDLSADGFGRVQFTFGSDGLAPAGYELVLFGQRSRLTAVQGFVIE